MNPRPESRVESLEKRASTIEATLIELSNDTAEELKAIRHDIKQVDDGIRASYLSIGEALDRLDSNTEAMKQSVSTIEARLDKIEGAMAAKDDTARLEGLIKRLLPQEPSE